MFLKIFLRRHRKVNMDDVVKMKLDGFGIAKGAKSFEEEEESHEEFW